MTPMQRVERVEALRLAVRRLVVSSVLSEWVAIDDKSSERLGAICERLANEPVWSQYDAAVLEMTAAYASLGVEQLKALSRANMKVAQ